MELIPVSKDGEYIEVHPTCVDEHKRLGWQACEKRETEEPGDASEKEALFAALDAKGIAYKKTMGVERLKALLEG
ncbi:MAG: hypothetical protein ACRDAM_17190 [Casimicrobium sp.]